MAEQNKPANTSQASESTQGQDSVKNHGFDKPGRSWPELVGVPVEEAKRKIKEDMPEAHIVVMPPHQTAWTADFSPSRVRIAVDEDGKVKQAPHTG